MGWKSIDFKVVKQLLARDLPVRVIKQVIGDNHLLVNSDKPARVVLVSDELVNVFNKVKSRGLMPLFLGLSVLDSHDFVKARMALPFASLASKLDIPRVVVNIKAEQLFLYGRDVWSDSIISVNGVVKRGRVVFVFNGQGLFIGLAFALGDRLLGKGKRVVLKNVIDLGFYLRCERQ